MPGEKEKKKEEPPAEPLLDQIARNEEPLINVVNAVADRLLEGVAEGRKYKRALAEAQALTGYRIVKWVFLLIGIAFALTTYLVLAGVLSGETFVFLLGTLLGSLITLLVEKVMPLLYLPIEEEVL
ncbi:MAG: hypothetical protein V3U45_05645 [bacterium]